MHDAAEAGNLEILQELLKSGAGVCYDFFNTSQFVYCYIKICERDSKSFDLYNMVHTLSKYKFIFFRSSRTQKESRLYD